MKSGWMLFSVLAGFLGVALLAAPAQAGEAKADAKALFTTMKCNSCHSISAQGVKVLETEGEEAEEPGEAKKVPDLSGVGLERNAAWIKDFLNKKADIEGRKHRKKFEGTPADLDALANWLATQKTAPAK